MDTVPEHRMPTYLGLSNKDVSRCSLVRAIQHLITEGTVHADLEMECSREISKRLGKGTGGMFLPLDIQERTMTIAIPGAGGYLVGTQLLGGSFIDVMRARVLPFRLGMPVLSMQRGPAAISRKTAGVTTYWVAEGEEITASDPEFDLLVSVPRTVGCLIKYSRDLLITATPNLETMLMQDVASEFGVAISKACFHGDGDKHEPIGLERVAGVGSVDGEELSWEKVLEFESDVSNANAEFERAAWAMSPTTRALLRKLPKTIAGDSFFIGDDNKMAGAPTFASNCISDGYLFYGDWAQALLIEYGILEILVNPYRDMLQGWIRLRGLQTVDVVWKHPDAFAMSDNVT